MASGVMVFMCIMGVEVLSLKLFWTFLTGDTLAAMFSWKVVGACSGSGGRVVVWEAVSGSSAGMPQFLTASLPTSVLFYFSYVYLIL